MHQLTAGKGGGSLKFLLVHGQVEEIVGVCLHVLVGCNHEAEGAAGGIVTLFAGLGSDETSHHVDQHTGRKILSRTGFLLGGVLLQ